MPHKGGLYSLYIIMYAILYILSDLCYGKSRKGRCLMRKMFVLFLMLCVLLCFGGCSRYEGKIKQESQAHCAAFTFDDFVGTRTVKLKRSGLGDGQFYYRSELSDGSMTVSYKMGWFDKQWPLFHAEAGAPLDSCGHYIWDGSIFITFASDIPVSGTIIISFVPFGE